MLWIDNHCDTSLHLRHFQNIHQWLECSWWKNLQPRIWNIVRRATIHRVEGRTEWDNSSAIRCAFCPSRSNMAMWYFQTRSVLECQTLVGIEPTIDRKSRNPTQRYHSVESMLKFLVIILYDHFSWICRIIHECIYFFIQWTINTLISIYCSLTK